jgi:hypothetical protein
VQCTPLSILSSLLLGRRLAQSPTVIVVFRVTIALVRLLVLSPTSAPAHEVVRSSSGDGRDGIGDIRDPDFGETADRLDDSVDIGRWWWWNVRCRCRRPPQYSR